MRTDQWSAAAYRHHLGEHFGAVRVARDAHLERLAYTVEEAAAVAGVGPGFAVRRDPDRQAEVERRLALVVSSHGTTYLSGLTATLASLIFGRVSSSQPTPG
jgi:hypothetical protein